MKKTITESQLKRIVSDSIKKILKEDYDNPHARSENNPELFGVGNPNIPHRGYVNDKARIEGEGEYYNEWKSIYDKALDALNELETRIEIWGSELPTN